MKALVGYTGFVGSNLYCSNAFQYAYNSKNISDAFGLKPDLLIYAGLRAEKFLANNAPEKDLQQIFKAKNNIREINPKKLVLISTIDVFAHPTNVNEDSIINTDQLQPYGLNRLQLERWVRENYPEALIVRLPGLYGLNLKKNFIYDYIHIIPQMLKADKFHELCQTNTSLQNYYTELDNGFYRCKTLTSSEQAKLKDTFLSLHFTALNFTDSRSIFQFYPLSRLWMDIQTALDHNLKIFHPATEPICVSELYQYLTGNTFINEFSTSPANYNYQTNYSSLFGGSDNYIMKKQELMSDIRIFVEGHVQ